MYSVASEKIEQEIDASQQQREQQPVGGTVGMGHNQSAHPDELQDESNASPSKSKRIESIDRQV